jgi:hypothetical protein
MVARSTTKGNPDGSKTGRPAASNRPKTAIIKVTEVLASSDTFTATMGTYNGTPALIKLFSPDSTRMAAYGNEVAAYRQLKAEQQEGIIPRKLGHGPFCGGTCYLATGLIQGVPLSRVARPARQQAAAAAVAAVQRLHRVPGFLHGSLHLGNIMVPHPPEGRDTDVRCVVLELGGSRFDATPAEQRREMKELESRLNH